MSVNLGEGRPLMRRKDYLSKSPLARVRDVFDVNEEAEFAEHLFAEDSQHPVRPCPEAVGQKLAARVVSLYACLESSLPSQTAGPS